MSHLPWTFPYHFYTNMQLQRPISPFIVIFLFYIFFVWERLAQIVGAVTWHGRWTPSLRGRNSLKCSKLFFVHVILCPPQKFFSIWSIFQQLGTIWNLHFSLMSIQIWNYTGLYLCSYWSVFTYFLFGNVRNRSSVKWYGMEDEPPISE